MLLLFNVLPICTEQPDPSRLATRPGPRGANLLLYKTEDAANDVFQVHAVSNLSSSKMPTAAVHSAPAGRGRIPVSATSHPDNPIPEEPRSVPILADAVKALSLNQVSNASQSSQSVAGLSESDSDSAETPVTEHSDDDHTHLDVKSMKTERRRRASTALIAESSEDVQRILGNLGTGGTTQLVEKVCCGGGCCLSQPLPSATTNEILNPISTPDNQAFRSLNLKIRRLALDSELTSVVDLPEKTVSFSPVPAGFVDAKLGPQDHPPQFVQPHPPYDVFRAPLHHARELTKSGAEKKTYHFDIDVTDYPEESGDVDFVVGGAIGVCPMNSDEAVDAVFNCLGIPKPIRDKKVTVRTTNGRWPTIWGAEQARELTTTRRELLRWCSDIQSYPPTKQLFRVLAEYASDPSEKKILMYLCSAQGQGGGRKWMLRGGWVRINLIKTCRGGAAPKTGRYLLRVRLYRYGETIYNL